MPDLVRAASVAPPKDLIILPETITSNSVILFWDKPEMRDNIAGFQIYKDDALIGTTSKNRTFFAVTNLIPGAACTLHVQSKGTGRFKPASTPKLKIAARAAGPVLDVTSAPYYAKGDGSTLNTAALQNAINDCPKGGTVAIPAGTFLTGPLVLKSHMSLYIAENGILKGSTDAKDYLPMIRTRYQGIETNTYQPLIRLGVMDSKGGCTSEDVQIYGEGEIQGGGEMLASQQNHDQRGQLISILNSKNVAIMGIHLTSSPGWTIHPLYSENITVWNTSIESWDTKIGRSSDGVNPDSSINCYIVNSRLHTSGNSIGLKSGRQPSGTAANRPTKHIRAVGCVFQNGRPCLGTECAGGIEDIVIRDSTVVGPYIEVRTIYGRGGYMKNFVCEDVAFKGNVSKGIWIQTDFARELPKEPALPQISGFKFKNIIGCGDISMDGGFGLTEGPDKKFYVRDMILSNVELVNGRSIDLKYCNGIQLYNVRHADGTPVTCSLAAKNYNVIQDGTALSEE